MQGAMIRKWLPIAFIFAAGAAFPFLSQSGYQLRIVMLIWIYAIFGMGFNLLFGIAGQLSLGQQAFFGIGAYIFALLQNNFGLSLPLAMLASVAICAVCGLLIALPVLRLRTHYLAMATLMFGMLVQDVALRWTEVTGGSSGLRIPFPALLGYRLDRVGVYFFVLCVAALAYLLQVFIMSSHLGRALEAVKTDETAASSLGINVTRYKISIFVLAAIYAAVGGICYSIVSRQVEPSYSGIGMAVSLLTLVVVGGLGSRIGPFLGAAIVILAPQFLVGLQEYQTLAYGIGLLVFMIYMPQGLGGIAEQPGKASRKIVPAEPTGDPLARAGAK
jgi:branched-chain amino acid transport system permease protein